MDPVTTSRLADHAGDFSYDNDGGSNEDQANATANGFATPEVATRPKHAPVPSSLSVSLLMPRPVPSLPHWQQVPPRSTSTLTTNTTSRQVAGGQRCHLSPESAGVSSNGSGSAASAVSVVDAASSLNGFKHGGKATAVVDDARQHRSRGHVSPPQSATAPRSTSGLTFSRWALCSTKRLREPSTATVSAFATAPLNVLGLTRNRSVARKQFCFRTRGSIAGLHSNLFAGNSGNTAGVASNPAKLWSAAGTFGRPPRRLAISTQRALLMCVSLCAYMLLLLLWPAISTQAEIGKVFVALAGGSGTAAAEARDCSGDASRRASVAGGADSVPSRRVGVAEPFRQGDRLVPRERADSVPPSFAGLRQLSADSVRLRITPPNGRAIDDNIVPENDDAGATDTTLAINDVFISVKTTRKFHRSRLDVIIKTWFQLAKDQTYFFTDADDEVFIKKTDGHMINTRCPSSHNRRALCCKMGAEFDRYLESRKKWWCHFDDDNYVNVPRLVRTLERFDHRRAWYLGRSSLKDPIDIRQPVSLRRLAAGTQRFRGGAGGGVGSITSVAFWFATGGAGFCVSQALAVRMKPIASGGNFSHIGNLIRLPDDVTMGYIAEVLLGTPLRPVPNFHSHLEPLGYLEQEEFHEQISFSYSRTGNVVSLNDAFDHHIDPTRFLSLHCYLFSALDMCRQMRDLSLKLNGTKNRSLESFDGYN